MSRRSRHRGRGFVAKACAGALESWEAVAEFSAGDNSPKRISLRKKGEQAEEEKSGTIFVSEEDVIYVTKVTPQHDMRQPAAPETEWWFEAKSSDMELEWPEGLHRIPAGVAIQGQKHVRFCCRATKPLPLKPRKLQLTFAISITRHKVKRLKEAGLGLNRSERRLLGQITK